MEFDTWLKLVALFMAGGLTPGPAVMLVLASAFRYGFRPAMLAALGIASANVVWLALAASGAMALLTIYPRAFIALKIIGLLVILYLALTTMFGPLPDAEATAEDAPPRGKLYSRGVALQLSSPMPLVYFGLLLPVYFSATAPLPPQILIMFLTVTVTEMLGLAAYAYGADRIKLFLRGPKAARTFNVLIGLVMIISGLWAVLSST
ncbi:LysE family translocator [Litorimonas sp. RW-G-Af-16]|uniref:LysE family translocator n=1 Tax=Litorimonas sp. RW-G-Af-16 TaxID=3241168 RepID=UPI00390C4CA6